MFAKSEVLVRSQMDTFIQSLGLRGATSGGKHICSVRFLTAGSFVFLLPQNFQPWLPIETIGRALKLSMPNTTLTPSV